MFGEMNVIPMVDLRRAADEVGDSLDGSVARLLDVTEHPTIAKWDYTRALELRPNDLNVRTDLGTPFWYGGFPEKAIAEYQKSLAVDPT